MTLRQVKKVIKDLREKNFSTAYLTMPTPNFRGRYPMRVRTPFGLARWYPSSEPTMIRIYPTVEQLEKYVKKQEASHGE